jgi:RNA polymerase sigma-70 factor (ECF subfamily)
VSGPSAEAAVDPDWEVLRRVAGGDVEAFGALVERHQERLVRLCTRLLHDPDEARDAAQEVFLRAFRKAASYRPRGQVFTWLYRIAVNHCLNRLRRRGLVRFLSLAPAADAEESALEPADAAPDALREMEARASWRRTGRAIARLPAGQRAVLALAKFEGMAYREIAQTLGISEGAVESRLFRAMRALERAQESGAAAVSRRGERR